MNFKKEYIQLVKKIKEAAKANGLKFTDTYMGSRLGMSRSHFNTLIGKSGKVTQDHVRELRNEFRQELKGVFFAKPENKEDDLHNKALLKLLAQDVAKLQSKVYDRPLKDCLEEMDKNTTLILRGMLE